MKTIYLDNASTSFPKPDVVYRSMIDYGKNVGASPHRGAYSLAQQAYRLVSECKELLCDLLGLKNQLFLHFTSNATHAANIVINSLVKPASHGIITSFDHNAVIRPVHEFSSKRNADYSVLKVNPFGEFEHDELLRLVKPNTTYITINHASNVNGSIINLQKLITASKKCGLKILLDVSQTVGLIPIKIDNWDVDFVIGTCHKSLLAPSGLGFLVVKEPYLLDKYMFGGSGHNSVSPFHPANASDRFTAGTQNYLAIAGLKAALEWHLENDQSQLFSQKMLLAHRLVDGLKNINGIKVLSPLIVKKSIPVVAFIHSSISSMTISDQLDKQYGICTRCGIHCAPLMHEILNTKEHGAVRVSIGYANTSNQIETCLIGLNTIINNYLGENFEKVS